MEAASLAEWLDLSRLYMKLEGATPTGNHKHHLARVVGAACRAGAWPGVAVASCGHMGLSVAAVCRELGLLCRVFLVDGCPLDVTEHGAALDGDHPTYEHAVAACAEWATVHGWLNATPGYELAGEYRAGYGKVAGEIVSVLGDAPDAVVCPVGNGTTLAGVFSGFEGVRGVRLPRHYGATSHDNALAAPPRPQLSCDWALEPLHAALPLDGMEASRAVARSGGRFVALERRDVLRATGQLWKRASLCCHPASGAAIAAVRALRTTGEIGRGECVVAILTTLHSAGLPAAPGLAWARPRSCG